MKNNRSGVDMYDAKKVASGNINLLYYNENLLDVSLCEMLLAGTKRLYSEPPNTRLVRYSNGPF
jgi:hypothetical protein